MKMSALKAKGNSLEKGSQEREAVKKEFEDAKAELLAAQKEKTEKTKNITWRYKPGATVNVPLLKAKLKNMVRQVRDYPELKHKIGGLNILWNQQFGAFREDTSQQLMSARTNAGALEKATLAYDAYFDRDSPQAQTERDTTNAHLAKGIGNLDKVGNHELGHVLESTLNISATDHSKGNASNDILNTILPNAMSENELNQVNYNAQDRKNAYDKDVYQGHIDTESPIFKTKK